MADQDLYRLRKQKFPWQVSDDGHTVRMPFDIAERINKPVTNEQQSKHVVEALFSIDAH